MTGADQLAYPLAALMLTVAAYCAGRIAATPVTRSPAGRAGRDADLAHVAMGVATAGMLIPRLNPLLDSGWVVIFAASTAWFAWRTYRERHRTVVPDAGAAHHAHHERHAHDTHYKHHALHLVHSAAMLFMLLAAGPATQPAGLVIAITLLGCAVWDADRSSTAQLLAPRLARLCRITLGVTMSYILIGAL